MKIEARTPFRELGIKSPCADFRKRTFKPHKELVEEIADLSAGGELKLGRTLRSLIFTYLLDSSGNFDQNYVHLLEEKQIKQWNLIVSKYKKLKHFAPCEKCGIEFSEDELFSYVDGNNGAITKNAPSLCKECYNVTPN